MYLWLVAGAMLCSVPACALDGDQLWIRGLDNWGIVSVLRQMKNIAPHECLNDRRDFKFPWERRNIIEMSKTQHTCLTQRMLQQTFNLFVSEQSHAPWNSTLLSDLFLSLHHHLDRLSETQEDRVCSDFQLPVQDYFRRIRKYLKEKKYSPCAWEIVRIEIKIRIFILEYYFKEAQ